MSSQGMLIASCCCAPQPFLCEDWQACLPRRAMLTMSYLETIEEIVGGTPRYTQTTSKSLNCELEAVTDALGRRLYLQNLAGGSGAYFTEQLYYEVPRGTQPTGGGGPDNPLCAIPCNTPYLCRREATQLQTNDLTVEVRCKNPCSGGFGSFSGNAYTYIQAAMNGVGTASTTYSNQAGICLLNQGEDSSYEAPMVASLGAIDVAPRCVSEFDEYVLQELLPINGCVPTSAGFVCNPFVQGDVLSATPFMSALVESCPEVICEDFICLAPDPSDPFGVIVVSECGCANFPFGTVVSNNGTEGERIFIYRRQVQSNVSLVVTEP